MFRRLFSCVVLAALLLSGASDVWARPLASLSTSLVAYYKLGEVSGTRQDELSGCGGSGCDLTDNNTVTQATGIIGNAAQFTAANSEQLTKLDHADISSGNVSYYVSAWVYLDSKPTNGNILTKQGNSANTEFRLKYTGGATDRFQFIWQLDAIGNAATVSANTFGAPSLSTWYLIEAYHDATNNTIGIAVNGGAFNTAAASGGNDGTASLSIGAGNSSGYFDGRIDEVAIWKRVPLDATDRAELYNGGVGCTYSFGCSATSTPTSTSTSTLTPTNTPTASDTPSPTSTSTSTITLTPTSTNTAGGPTDTPTDTPTATLTPTPSNTPVDTDTPTPTSTDAPTATSAPTSTLPVGVSADDMVGIMYLLSGLDSYVAFFLGAFLVVWVLFIVRWIVGGNNRRA